MVQSTRQVEPAGCRCSVCPTRKVCLASCLDYEALARLSERLDTSEPLAVGAHVYRAGDAATAHYQVRSGVVKTYAINAAGDEFVTGFHYPGEIVGAARVDGGYADSAVMIDTGTICDVPDAEVPFLYGLGAGPSLMAMLADRNWRATRHQMDLVQPRADARVAGFLLELSARLQKLGWSGERLPVPMSRTDLANYLGMTLECLSRVLARFKRAGLIGATRTHIDILDPDSLQSLGQHAMP